MLLPLPSNGAVLPCRTGPVGMRDPETSHCLLHRVIRFYNLKLGQIIWNSNEETALICHSVVRPKGTEPWTAAELCARRSFS